MNIKCIKTGILEENCYVISIDCNVLIIDPGDSYEKIVNEIGDKKVLSILITHYHFDHVGALEDILRVYDVPVIDYRSSKINKVGPFNFEIIDTKGHKEDCVTYYFRDYKVMFTGDFIFKGTIGRCDLFGGDFDLMMKSLKNIRKYNKDITLYPGHGDKTTINDELLNNYYLRGDYDE